jgi:hypothetical protein
MERRNMGISRCQGYESDLASGCTGNLENKGKLKFDYEEGH